MTDSELLEDTDAFCKIIGHNVKKFRKQAKISQLKFSNEIGMNSVSFYCDCENAKNGKHFNLIHIVRISKVLKIDINKIVDLKQKEQILEI